MDRSVPFLVLAFLWAGGTVFPQGPSLLGDLNRKPAPNPSSNPIGSEGTTPLGWDNEAFPRIGASFFFFAWSSVHGEALWKAGTLPGQASFVRQTPSGAVGRGNDGFLAWKGLVFFSSWDPLHGMEVWRSDGTGKGTFLLKDCFPRTGSGGFHSPVVSGNRLFWTTYGGNGADLWVSDGTPAGTKFVRGGFREVWGSPVPLGGKVIFGGRGDSRGYEPWITDGTKAGTRLLKDVNPGKGSGFFSGVFMGGKVYFFSYSGKDWGLYVTDGTPGGTKRIAGGFRDAWSHPFSWGKKIIFGGDTSSSGVEPWVTDGTPAGTFLLKEIQPGGVSGGFLHPVLFKNRVFFLAAAGGTSKNALWETDGTRSGTKVVSSRVQLFEDPTAVGGTLFFRGKGSSGTAGVELWATDGTGAGTRLVKDIYPGPKGSFPSYMTAIGNLLFFSAGDPLFGREIWVSDGTSKGTVLLDDIGGGVPYNKGSDPFHFLDVCGITYFTADDGIHGREIWRTDGTPSGTRMVVDLIPGPGGAYYLSDSRMNYWRTDSALWKPVSLGNQLFFQGEDSNRGGEIWKTDGTAAGTVLVKDIRPGPGSGGFRRGCVLGGKVYFFAWDGKGYALWRTDGTAPGTVKIQGGFSHPWAYPYAYRGKIYFRGSTGITRYSPWVTDGTASGTFRLAKVAGGCWAPDCFRNPVGLGKWVYFWGFDPNTGKAALWRTDGTKAGTAPFFFPFGPGGSQLCAMGDFLYFEGQDPWHGKEPWISDGTPQGTRILKDINPGYASGGVFFPCVAGDRLFFAAEGPHHGRELWVTDGTAAGTRMVKDIRVPGSSYPQWITAIGSRKVVFSAKANASGFETWVSDGTAAGTRLVEDLLPGLSGSMPWEFTLSGGRVVFSAQIGPFGREPLAWFPGATADPCGWSSTWRAGLSATDPVLGKPMQVRIRGMGPGSRALLVLGGATHDPLALGLGWVYLDPGLSAAWFLVNGSGGGSLSLPVPGVPALERSRAAIQGFIFPASRGPLGFDSTNGVLLAFGR